MDKPCTSGQQLPGRPRNILSVERDWNTILQILHDGEESDCNLSEDEVEDDDVPLLHRLDQLKVKRVGADKVGRDEISADTILEVEQEDEDAVEVEDEEEDEEVPEVHGSNTSLDDTYASIMLTPKESFRWKRKPLTCIVEEYEPPNFEEHELLSPIHYFKKYVSDDLFSVMAMHTNMYALQQGKTSFKQTTRDEIEVLFGLHVLAGTLKFPRIRMYWNATLKVNVFLENMARDRFFELRTNLHLVDNLQRPPDNKDKFYKVRPIYTAIRKQCNQIQIEESVCVDEGMIPFTGKFSAKQYVKGKPNPWGIKMFMLCGKSGIVHDFILYQGATTELNATCYKKFGLGPAVVLELSKQLSNGKGHKLYFDNFFSSYHLFQALKSQGIYAAGTVRPNRFGKNLPFSDDKTIMKQTRGFCEEITSADDITMCKWVDNRPVVLCSNFVGKGSVDEVERWEKKNKRYVKVKRPEIVKNYNHAMGGVDLFDQLISYYRIFIRSRKWTLRMIFHAVDFAIVQSWLEYRRDAENLGIPKRKQLDLLAFRIRVADGLIVCQKQVSGRKRGRPSGDGTDSSLRVIPRRKGELRPAQEIQYDTIDHLPLPDDGAPSRCKFPKCTGRSRIQCKKCKVHLCLLKDRNCFLHFHTKP